MKNFIPLLLFFITATGFAQEGLKLMPLQQDSSRLAIERQMEYNQLVSGRIPESLFTEKIKLPSLNFHEEFAKRYSFTITPYSGVTPLGLSYGYLNPFYSPYFVHATVLSEGAYKLGEKFTFGGYSIGLHSMVLPPAAAGSNKFNSYGSSMFLQYKVNKNFKIETRIDVHQGGIYPGF